VVEHANIERNDRVLTEIVSLFRSREAIPGEAEFPEVRPLLPSYAFPYEVLTDATLAAVMTLARIDRIRASLRHQNRAGSMIAYRTRWFDESAVERDSIDLLFSQAVLEHVDDLPATYQAMRLWVKPEGMVSHQIDFRCHNHRAALEWPLAVLRLGVEAHPGQAVVSAQSRAVLDAPAAAGGAWVRGGG